MENNKYLLSFIENINSIVAFNAKKMEELIYEDPSSAIVKARLFAEEVLNVVFDKEEIGVPYINSLSEKISYLAREGYITREIQKSFDTIRLTGNKAAHDGGFNDITQAFKLHRVMYDIGVWFYEVYSLEQLKVPQYDHPKPVKKEDVDIQELVKKQVLDLLKSGHLASMDAPKTQKNEKDVKQQIGFSDNNDEVREEQEQTEFLLKKLPEGESYLVRELKKLQDSAQEAVENVNTFSRFKKYMHVDRKIQTDIEEILLKNKDSHFPSLVLLCGSVGDGKSHLLAYLKENNPELITGYEIYNDATESFSPEKNAMETLEEILKDYSDEHLANTQTKAIIAINMGVLHNFISHHHHNFTFNRLNEFVDNSDLFSQNITTKYSEVPFDLISFGDYHSFELTETGPKSDFFLTLLSKIYSRKDDNPFYLAYKEDLANGIRTMVHENYEFMQDAFIQKQIVNLTIQTLVIFKLVISARAFLNFVADMMIPDHTNNGVLTEFERLEHSVPNLLFNRRERSPILKAMHDLDPLHIRSSHIDQLIIDLNTLSNWGETVDRYIHSDKGKMWLSPFTNVQNLTEYTFNEFSKTLVRTAFLTNNDFCKNVQDYTYQTFICNLYYFNSGNKNKIKAFYEEIKQVIYKWKGSPKRGYAYLNKPNDRIRLAQSLNLKPSIEHLRFNSKIELESFKSTILLGYHDGDIENKIYLEIDYPLYNLLLRVQDGYCPNKNDEEDAIRFVEFIDKVMKFGDKKKEVLFHFPIDDRFYKLKRDDFGAFVFERE